mmetsp:Transcript_69200/g.113350  ORF Transcript_69200/g.113350 Transcript_69200/m.113350 type:complete len:216 (-) Transcript_69200:443-1090(-)
MAAIGMCCVHDQHELYQRVGMFDPLLQAQSVASPWGWKRIVRHKTPQMHLPCTARMMLGAGDDLLHNAGAMFGWRYVRHAGGDLSSEAMVQILQPWIDVDVVLEPRNEEQHVGQAPGNLKDSLSCGLTDQGHIDVWKVRDDPRTIAIRIQCLHTAPHRTVAIGEDAESDPKEPVEDVVHHQTEKRQYQCGKEQAQGQHKGHPKPAGAPHFVRARL